MQRLPHWLHLADHDATVNELAEPFDLSLPAISKHLKVLERCGLISRGRRAQFRLCYLEPAALEVASGWIEDHRSERYDKLDAHLRTLQQPNSVRNGSPPN